MKTASTIFKGHLYLLFILISFCLDAQVLHNIGIGSGFYKGEPITVTNADGKERFVGSRDFQFLNLSYEPRLSLVDSILNQFSISIGTPIALGFSLHEEFGSTVRLGHGSAQAAAIAYLNWGNGSSYRNRYHKKWGLSIGFGMSYLHSGIFKKKVDIIKPKNNLIKPVMSYSIRYKTNRDVIMELNFLWRFAKNFYLESCERVEPWGYWECTRRSYREQGGLVQFKFFFGG